MYFDLTIREIKLDKADSAFMGLYLGCYLALYLKEKRRRKKVLMKKLDDIRGGFDIDIRWVDYGHGFDIRGVELILKSKRVKVRIVTFIVNFLALNKSSIIPNFKLLGYLFLNASVIWINICTNGIHPIVIFMISAVVGFALSYLPVVANFVTPRAILAIFLWRSARQMIHHLLVEVILRRIYEILEMYIKYFERNGRKKIQPGLFTNRKPLPITNKIKMKLSTPSEIQKDLQKFEILQQNNVTNAGKLHINTLDCDPELEKMLGLWKMPKHQFSMKEKILNKAKTVCFRNFIKGNVDVDNVSNLSIINAEIVEQALKSQIKAD